VHDGADDGYHGRGLGAHRERVSVETALALIAAGSQDGGDISRPPRPREGKCGEEEEGDGDPDRPDHAKVSAARRRKATAIPIAQPWSPLIQVAAATAPPATRVIAVARRR
jgi:hypothetical protein